MATYANSHHYQVEDVLRQDYTHTEFKSEPFELEHPPRATYTYSTQHPYSEEELVESLSWIDYTQGPHTNTQHHPMQLTPEMTMQQHSLHHRAPSLQQSSLASNGTFGSTSVPPAGHSPNGWHSSMESPSFAAEPMNHSLANNVTSNPLTSGEPVRKDGSMTADRRAMRRYSHNAVERRRRDNINEQIQELSILVSDMSATLSCKTETVLTGPPNNTKPNKGLVLQRSVEYIRLLKSLVEEKSNRERQLEQEITRLGGKVPPLTARDSAVSMWIDESAIEEDDDDD